MIMLVAAACGDKADNTAATEEPTPTETTTGTDSDTANTGKHTTHLGTRHNLVSKLRYQCTCYKLVMQRLISGLQFVVRAVPHASLQPHHPDSESADT